MSRQALRTTIITGANKGIGLAVADNLAGKEGWSLILACRNKERAEQARRKLLEKHPRASIEVEQLDIANEESISRFTGRLRQTNRQISVLVNNAGTYIKPETPQSVRDTLSTNFYGTIMLTEQLLPQLSNSGKIITLGSSLGKYKVIKDEALRKLLKNANRKELFALLQQYQEGVNKATLSYSYPSAYIMSKMAINIFVTKVLPLYPEVIRKEIQVYAQCPGYVATDMTEFKGFLTAEKGAMTTVYLTELPFQVHPDLQGRFFERGKVSEL